MEAKIAPGSTVPKIVVAVGLSANIFGGLTGRGVGISFLVSIDTIALSEFFIILSTTVLGGGVFPPVFTAGLITGLSPTGLLTGDTGAGLDTGLAIGDTGAGLDAGLAIGDAGRLLVLPLVALVPRSAHLQRLGSVRRRRLEMCQLVLPLHWAVDRRADGAELIMRGQALPHLPLHREGRDARQLP